MTENHNPKSLREGRVICTCGDYNCASLTQIENIELNEDEFDAKYKPMVNGDEDTEPLTWEFPEVVKVIAADKIGINQVWSLVDGDDGGAYALPGFHVVNVFGYCVTEVPWEHENITGEWIPAHSDELDDPIINTPECGE